MKVGWVALLAAVLVGCGGATTGIPAKLAGTPDFGVDAKLKAATASLEEVQDRGRAEAERAAVAAERLEASLRARTSEAAKAVDRAGEEAAARQRSATAAVQGSAGQVLSELEKARTDLVGQIRTEGGKVVSGVDAALESRQRQIADQWARQVETVRQLAAAADEVREILEARDGQTWFERLLALAALIASNIVTFGAARRKGAQVAAAAGDPPHRV